MNPFRRVDAPNQVSVRCSVFSVQEINGYSLRSADVMVFAVDISIFSKIRFQHLAQWFFLNPEPPNPEH
jgi:hypothetical protein